MKRVSIAKRLFRVYTRLFSLFFAAAMILVTLFIFHFLQENIIETQKQMAMNVTQTIEGYFSDVNDFSMSLTNSDKFKEAVINEIPNSLRDAGKQNQALMDVYSAAYVMFEKGYMMGVYTKDGTYLWLSDRILAGKIENETDFYEDYHQHGKPIIFLEPKNELLCQVPGGEKSRYADEATLVLARSINRRNHFTNPQAILEVHVPYKDFVRFVERTIGKTNLKGLSISITNKAGELLYGEEPPMKQGKNDWKQIDGNMVMTQEILMGELTLCYTIPLANYYQQMLALVLIILLIFAVVMGLMVGNTYRVSNTITEPIAAMSAQLEESNMLEDQELRKVRTDIYELDLMARTIQQMQKRLKDALQQIVHSKTAALQSSLMALQSQMQPHFLYNTLAVISSLSNQGKPEAVSNMCNNLSKMLRYTSSENEKGVTLYEEVMFLNSYSSIMKERFPESKVHIDIPFDMMNIRTPKMILQPLCENSYKYVGRQNVEIWIKGQMEQDCWTIRIWDNGPGFKQEKIDDIMKHCEEIRNGKNALTTQIDGMGLVNIYARLSIFYPDSFAFRIDPQSGITIGGKC